MGDYTELVVLLDRSGSMQDAKSDHEGGLNSFVNDQKDLAGTVRFTLIQFDSENPCEVVHDGVAVQEVGKCVLVPRGGTPLLDAIGRSVAHVKTRLDGQSRKPDAVIFMIITDGQENQSQEFTKPRVKSLIEDQEKAGWKFLFLGANIDAFAEAGGLGISAATTMSFTNDSAGVSRAYASHSHNVSTARSTLTAGGSLDVAYASLNFTDEQREEAAGKTATATGTETAQTAATADKKGE